MGAALAIRQDLTPAALRQRAKRERNGRAAARMYAIAHALEGMRRAEAARLAGMERQALRDAVVSYNAHGLAGLYDRPKGHPPRLLTAEEEADLKAAILRDPDPERDGTCSWTRADMAHWMEVNLGKTCHPASLSRVFKRMGLSRKKARPRHPQRDPEASEQFQKKGCKRR